MWFKLFKHDMVPRIFPHFSGFPEASHGFPSNQWGFPKGISGGFPGCSSGPAASQVAARRWRAASLGDDRRSDPAWSGMLTEYGISWDIILVICKNYWLVVQ